MGKGLLKKIGVGKKDKHPKAEGEPSNAGPAPEPPISSSAGQDNSTSPDGSYEMDVSSENAGSVVSASTGRQTHGHLTSPAASSEGQVTQVTSDMSDLRIQDITGAPNATEGLPNAQEMRGAVTAGIIAGSVNNYGKTRTVVQQGPKGSIAIGTLAENVTHHVGSQQEEVLLDGTGPDTQGFAAATVASNVERHGTACRIYGGDGDFPIFGTPSYPREEGMYDESTPAQPPNTQPISTGPGVNLPVLGMVGQLMPGVGTVNRLVGNHTVRGYNIDVMEQAPTGEFWVKSVTDQLTIQPGGVQHSILMPREDGASGGRTINMIANNIVNNGTSVSVVGGTRAQDIAARYMNQAIARQQNMLNRGAPPGNNGEGNGHIQYPNQIGGSGLPATNPCEETSDQLMRR